MKLLYNIFIIFSSKANIVDTTLNKITSVKELIFGNKILPASPFW